VIGYVRDIGRGGVTYIALGHCHNPAIRGGRAADPADTTPLTFHGSWETDAFVRLLRNAITWGMGN
jgi:hypothetical protein